MQITGAEDPLLFQDVAANNRGGGRDTRQAFFGATGSNDNIIQPGQIISLRLRIKSNAQAALRDGEWKYLMLGGKEHLFNLAEDERERADHASDAPARVKAMRLQWDSWNAQMLSYPLGSLSEDVREHYADRY